MDKKLLTKEELAGATGVAESTIGLYLKKGLITQPEIVSNYKGRKGRIGLYDPACVNRIRKIKELTEDPNNYTLEAIKKQFDEEGRNPLQKELTNILAEILKTSWDRRYNKEEINVLSKGMYIAVSTGSSSELIMENLEELKKIKERVEKEK